LLETLGFADEVVVFDAESQDRTAEIARDFGGVLLSGPNVRNLNENKTKAIEECRGEWAMYLDADERIGPKLAAEIRRAIEDDDGGYNAYNMPRLNNYFGRYLKYGGAYPDTQLRLFRRGKAHFPCLSVHEKLVVEGKIGRLSEPLHHESYPTVSDYLKKLPFYVEAQADYFERKGAKRGAGNSFKYFAFKPVIRFLRRYVLRLGFLDGWPGYAAAALDWLQMVLSWGAYLKRD
ncbi:MAG: glycosyltransferase family 2 protein, partial [bacterium]|nr:glycosyltransferase family 2 protein [bacterium]